MAGDWIKMRAGIEETPAFSNIAAAAKSGDPEETLFLLYRTACWFQTHGKYGKLTAEPRILDRYLRKPGFAQSLISAGWMRNNDGVLTLHKFCDVSTTRKSLGKRLRSDILSEGICAACGSAEKLVIDHKTPIVRGGSCSRENLQALCWQCNSRKGRKTMEEFLNDC